MTTFFTIFFAVLSAMLVMQGVSWLVLYIWLNWPAKKEPKPMATYKETTS